MDAVLDILSNATGIVPFVIGEKYVYSDPQNVKRIPDKTEVRRLSSGQSQDFIMLLKTGEHYNYLV